MIEEFLEGEEASFIVMCDGAHVLPLATSQDHKRLLDGDQGPNTGGMGAYSPAPVVTPEVHARVMREIILPAVQGMAQDGMPYTGFLYAGLMIDKAGNPKTLEFNCRLGDPETQPILLRLKCDLLDLVEHALDGTLDEVEAEWDRRAALGVVLAAHGYPDEPRKGDAIERPAEARAEDCHVFHAGTRLDGKNVGHQRRARAVRHRARRHGEDRAHARLRGARAHPLRRHAVPQGHRPPRAEEALAMDRAAGPRLLRRPAGAHRRRARSARRQAASAATPGSAPEGGGGMTLHPRGRQAVRARRRRLLARAGHAAAAVGERRAPAARRPRRARRWACRWSCIRAIPTARPCT